MKATDQRKQSKEDSLNKVSVIVALGEQWKEYYESITTAKVVSLDNAVFPKDITKIEKIKFTLQQWEFSLKEKVLMI